ncbi:MAG: ABC transporter substrate-binding protein [Anaerolineae bacterium]|nr:ABC transporter substrate-binding protein [Anaerolineae bacterium]
MALLGLLLIGSLVFAACATPTPITIKETVIVTEKVIVAGTPVIKEVVKEVVVTATPGAEAAATPEAAAEATYLRKETLYTSGTQWGPPSSWNPFNTGGNAMGTIGLCYETLFIYDPMTNEYTPWLAESGEWTSDTVYELKVREGVQWSDGEPFTAKDVKFTFEVGQTAPVNISTVWRYLDSIELVDDYNLKFNFKTTLYQQWGNTLYNTAIIPEHIWSAYSEEEITSGANESPIGTGPYLFDTYDQSRMVWVKNENWWAKSALNLDPQPKRIVDIVNGSNNVAMGMVLQGGLDLSNNFLPGIATLIRGGYGVQTYYPNEPYMLSANTAWLLLNLTKAPMDDAAFRKAIAFAINTDEIVSVDYGDIVMKANPTGLLPIWDQYVDQDVVEELGFTYDPEKARAILAEAGYKDTDGDGLVEAPDGSEIELKVNNPNGWTDWMEANKIIVKGLQAVGINAQSNYPDYGGYIDERNNGAFDMMIANDAQMSNTPWTYYNWMFQHPVEDIATLQNGNYGRYDNEEAFTLVDALDRVKVDDLEGMRDVISQMQTIQLTDMPLIPLWYNGAWAQYSNAVWTNWPSSADDANHYLPVTWRGYWNMTAILMLCDLELAPVQ